MKGFNKILIILVLAFIGLATDVEGCTIPSGQFIYNSALKNSEMQEEIWKDVVGYEGLYEVSDIGRIKSIKRTTNTYCGTRIVPEKILKLNTVKNGYVHVGICSKGTSKTFRFHRLVAIALIPNPQNKPCINHKNGIKTDNRVENLEWCTHSENIIHSYRTGLAVAHMTGKTGAQNPFSKKVAMISLSGDIIREFDSTSDVQRDMGIPNQAISRVCLGGRKTCRGYKWKYI